ncbi:MAG: hypothetical protein LQ342_006845 [Letrouitia transgressa]|nr:MAG: hypothetical protein LQ342_006845 [Letrouitia transgressa]
MFSTKEEGTQDPKTTPATASPLPSVNKPKGGGAVKAIDEKFNVNAATGTASTSITIPTSAARAGFGPQLSLNYDSGAGNGAFGLGWHIGLPEIARKTDRGLPRYEDDQESDTFILSGTEDLVPTCEYDGKGQWVRPVSIRHEQGRSFRIMPYRPRVEGAFSRIERWTDLSTQQSHWRTITGSNVTALYGYDQDSRVFDPRHPTRIFQWLISLTYDDRGNAMTFHYKRENGDNVPTGDLNEANIDSCARITQKYPKRIRYGNISSFLLNPEIQCMDWMFEVLFDYGEHDKEHPSTQETKDWDLRPDPFSTRRAGFEIRTYRLCRRILMIHHFPDEPNVGRDCVVSSLDIQYYRIPSIDNIPTNKPLFLASCISSVSRRDYVKEKTGYRSKVLPSAEFDYTSAETAYQVCDLDTAALEHLPGGVDGARSFFLDLDGEGIPGVLTQDDKSFYYSANRGGGRFDPPIALPFEPSPFSGHGSAQQWMDLIGDGQAELVRLGGSMPGYSKRDRGTYYGWSNFRLFESIPDLDFTDPNLRWIDLTGDGRNDILLADDQLITWHESWAENGFGPAITEFAPLDEDSGPRILFANGLESVHLADMTGDGLTDIVRIRNGEICYWPNLGRGRFGRKMSMKNPPFFDVSDQFKQGRLHLADIDGTGASDILYIGGEGAKYYLNQSGNTWTSAIDIPAFPRTDDTTSVQVVDLFGRGTSCLVWSSALPGHVQRQVRYIDLVGPVKPYLISATRNNLGAESRVHYSSSTHFYLQDKQSGSPWATRIPFPVQVVESVESEDRVSGNRFYSRYAYHHGYYDGREREFRGFGMVEQWDTEDLSTLGDPQKRPKGTNYDQISDLPPVLTKTWFHTGAFLEGAELQRRYECEFWHEPGRGKQEGWRALGEGGHLPKSVRVGQNQVAHHISMAEAYEASRALKGATIHSEIYALDRTREEARPYRVSHSVYEVELLQPRGSNEHAVFLTHQRESITSDYERQLYGVKGRLRADPRVAHSITLSIDQFGNVLEAATIAYGRRYACADPLLDKDDREKQSHRYITYTSSQFTNPVLLADARRLPMLSHTKQFELVNLSSNHDMPGHMSHILNVQQVREAVASVASGDRDLPYEDFQGRLATQPGTYRRLISHSLAVYRKNSLDGALPPGELESLAIPYETYTLSFSRSQLKNIFVESGKISPPQIDQVLADEGGYCRIDGQWWKPSGRSFLSPDAHHSALEELRYAQQHFFIPRRAEDPFGTSAFVEFDRYDLLVKETRDVYDNRTTVGQRADPGHEIEAESGFDYRLLTPYMVQDPNGNRAVSSFDIHGMVVGSASMGKPHERLGDHLDGFRPDLTEAQVQCFFTDPKALAQPLLAGASTRFVYDSFAYYRSKDSGHPKPSVVCSLSRETHASHLESGRESRVLIGLAYSDGLGRTIQEKVPAEPGPVTRLPDLRRTRKKDHSCQYGDDRTICNTRWITSGWTAYNNKGMKVRVYEPFFSRTHEYESDNKLGVSPITFYDPLGRAVGVLSPDHTWSKVLFEPWRSEAWDKNDTVLIENPANDEDVGDYFKRLSEGDYLPTWYQRHRDNSACSERRLAALKTAAHAKTPSYSFPDSLGRDILTVTSKTQQTSGTEKPESEYFYARKVLDIEGREHQIRDTKERVVSVMAYNRSGEALYNANMDNGVRWSLPDINGLPIRRWDDRGQRFRMTYDKLRRVENVYLESGERPETMVARTVHGESTVEPEQRNCRGVVVKLYDQSGLSITDQYDFKGNLVTSERRIGKEFRQTVDVSADVEFEPETYVNHVAYDALGRQTSMTLPNGTKTRYVYNVHGEIQQVWSKLHRTTAEKTFVEDVEYDAKGKQVRVDYGNGTTTRAKYDLHTFRLMNTRTTAARKRRGSSPPTKASKTLLDMSYTYDAMGNMLHCRDRAQETLYFRGKMVHPDQSFTYDSLYRLVQAEGREHLGQKDSCSTWSANDVSGEACQMRMDHPHNGNAMTRYVERYEYDSAGNIQKMQHESESWHSWTRRYRYREQSPLEPHQVSNRLSETQIGSSIATYRYDGPSGMHGNMTSLPSIPQLAWNFKDQLQSTCRQSSETKGPHEITWFVYDETGKRVRKVTEQRGAGNSLPRMIKQTMYIGSAYESFRTYHGSEADQSVDLEIETLSISSGGARLATVENRLRGKDSGIPAQLIRFQYSNYQSSVVLELDDDANTVSYEEYTPYGSTSFQAVDMQTEVPKRYRWTGKEKDTETGLYHNGLRYYMAGIARWTSADPQGLADGLNLYAYGRANPIAFSDPSGTDSVPPGAKGPPPRPNLNWGDLGGYYSNGPRQYVQKRLRPDVVQSHIGSLDALKWLTDDAYDKGHSAGNSFEWKGQIFKHERDPIMYHPDPAERLISKHMEPVIADLKAGKIPDAEGFFARTKGAFSAGIGQYLEEAENGLHPPTNKPVTFNESNFDKGTDELMAKWRRMGIPTEGYEEIARSKKPPPPPPPPPPPVLLVPQVVSNSSKGGGTGGVIGSQLSRGASAVSRGGSALRSGATNAVRTIASEGAGLANIAKTRLAPVADTAARAALPGYAEFAVFTEMAGPSYVAGAIGGSEATIMSATAIEAAPLASYAGLVVAPAIGGGIVGGAVGGYVRQKTGSNTAAVGAGALSGAATGAAVGAAIGVGFLGVGAPVGAAVGGAVGAIAGAWAAW